METSHWYDRFRLRHPFWLTWFAFMASLGFTATVVRTGNFEATIAQHPLMAKATVERLTWVQSGRRETLYSYTVNFDGHRVGYESRRKLEVGNTFTVVYNAENPKQFVVTERVPTPETVRRKWRSWPVYGGLAICWATTFGLAYCAFTGKFLARPLYDWT